jgi:hypothetical protein
MPSLRADPSMLRFKIQTREALQKFGVETIIPFMNWLARLRKMLGKRQEAFDRMISSEKVS